jgi:phage baseplate assembly protein W
MKATGNGNPGVCANNLLKTIRGEVPYERVKGLDPRLIDRPSGDVAAEIQQDAEWLLETYEPRITVNAINIEASGASSGSFRVTADIDVKEE